MKKIKLSPRLTAVVGFVPSGANVVDVGTDHGYLPVYLAQNGTAGRIIASDLRTGPLESARHSAAEYGVRDNSIEFVLADGLQGADGIGIDTVVIAGMGGETIIKILEDAPWLHENGVRLILQSQTKIGELSSWLDNNGYAIIDEVLALDEGRIYPVLAAGAGKSRAPFSCAEVYADRILMEKRDPLLCKYLDSLIVKMSRALDGMEKAARGVPPGELIHTELALRGFERMREETEKWQR